MADPHHTIDLSAGPIPYRDLGAGPTIVFVHGALVDSRLWDGVAERLAATHRVILPDLPLGSHTTPMGSGADLSPPGIAGLVLEFLNALDLTDVTIAGNDTGGAVTQMAVTRDHSRIGRLVLTNCDAFDVFPPRLFSYFKLLGRSAALTWLAAQSMRLDLSRRLPIAYGRLTTHRLPAELTDDWTRPLRESAEIRRDVRKLARGIDAADTLAAGAALADFDKPALIAWGRDDRCFVPRLAEQLVDTLPHAKLEWIDDATTFVSIDQPARLAELIEGFAG